MNHPRVIQIIPLGQVFGDDLRTVANAVRRRFSLEAAVMPGLPLPAHTFHSSRDQHDADGILDFLQTRLAPDISRIVGITGVDLYAADRDFVFGYAHMRDRVAVFSTYRLRDGARTPSRFEKAVVHELGHTFQAPHCWERACVMRQVQNIDQLDELSSDLCESCAARIAVASHSIVRA